MSSWFSRSRVIALSLVTASVAAVLAVGTVATSEPVTIPRVALPVSPGATETTSKSPLFDPGIISEVAERVSPAVVSITTRGAAQAQAMRREDFPNFFFFGPRGPRPTPESPEMGVASGVIVSEDGYVVTNNHVVDAAGEVRVRLSDGRELPAKIIGTDASSDLAVVKIEAKNLPYLRFGDSSQLRLGEFVLALGNPFGVGQTVTMGIVSAKGRSNIGIVDYEDFIQTDAAINPGNSGGALVNLEGALVGINTAILSRSGGAAGIGFAVPSNMAKPIIEQIRESGRVRRGWLGVAIQDLTPELAQGLDIKVDRGVVVSDVLAGGPADAAGLESGDVVLSIDGRKATSSAELRNLIAMMKPGTSTQLVVRRGSSDKTLSVRLGEKKEDQARGAQAGESQGPLSGVDLQPLTPALERQLELPPKVRAGVVVTDVDAASAAARSGLRPGDVIVSVNRQPVQSVEDVQKLASRGGGVLLRVYRQGSFLFVVLGAR